MHNSETSFYANASSKKTGPSDSLVESSASFWCQRIVAGEERTPYSSRDGKHLKRVSSSERLGLEQLLQLLADDFRQHYGVRSLAAEGSRYQKGSEEYKALLYLLRARIYLRSDNKDQAFKDAKCSLAYSEEEQTEACYARLLLVQIWHESGDYLNAALTLAEVLSYSQDSEKEHQQWLETLFNELPSSAQLAYSEGGLESLKEWADFQKELQKPPILQKRPKFYWYYQWMTKRIQHKCGFLPDPVMDKLLCMDANELDTVLSSTDAIRAQAAELLWILDARGPEELETYKTPELTWEEVKHIQETMDEESGSTNLLKDHEEDNEKLVTLITTPDEFLTRKQQLLTSIHQPQRSLTLQQEDSEESHHI